MCSYPASFCPGLVPTSSHVSEATGVRCYPSRENRGEKTKNIPIIRRAFPRWYGSQNKTKKEKISLKSHTIITTTTTSLHYCHPHHLQSITSVSSSTRSGKGSVCSLDLFPTIMNLLNWTWALLYIDFNTPTQMSNSEEEEGEGNICITRIHIWTTTGRAFSSQRKVTQNRYGNLALTKRKTRNSKLAVIP